MASIPGPSVDEERLVNDYIKELTERFAHVQDLINEYDQDVQDYNQCESQIQRDEDELSRLAPGFEDDKQEALRADIAALQGRESEIVVEMKGLETSIETLDPAMTDMISSIDNLLKSMSNLKNQDVGGQIRSDIQHIENYIRQIISAMRNKAEVDKDEQILNQDGSSGASDDTMQQIMMDMVQNGGQETSTLQQLMTTLVNDLVAYNKQYNDANADKSRFNVFEKFFNWGGASDQVDKDEKLMNSADAMKKAILSAMSGLATDVVSIDSQFEQLNLMIQEIMKKLESILKSGTLSPKEKQTQLLSLLMFVLGLFNFVQTIAENHKGKNQESGSDANIIGSEMNIDNAQAAQKIQEEEAANAQVLKIVMFVAKVVMGAILAMLAPGIGSALVAAAMTVADTCGGPNGDSVVDKLTKELASATGQTWAAEAIMTAIEVVGTMGGGAALDRTISSFAQKAADSAVNAALKSVEQTITKTALATVTSLGKASEPNAILGAEHVLQESASKAAEKAAVGAYKMFAQQTFLSQVEMAFKGTYQETVQAAMVKAATKAAEGATEEGNALIASFLRGNSVDVELETIAKKEAKEAISDTLGVSTDDVAKSTERSAAKTALIRGTGATVYGMAENNLLLEIALASAKAAGHDQNSDIGQELKIIMQVIQQIVMMVSQLMVGGGTGNLLGSPQAMTNAAKMLQSVPQGVNSIAALGMYQVENAQGDATKRLAVTEMTADFLRSALDQANQNNKAESNRFAQQLQSFMESNLRMASRLSDGDNAGIQVLVSQAV